MCALSLSAILLSCGRNDQEPAAQPIRVGVVMPLTGASSVHGQDALAAIRMAQERVNAAGGVNGRRIELVVEDNASLPAKVVEAMQKMIDVDKVCVIIGPISSSETLAGAEVATRAKVVLFSPTAASPKIHGASPYCFSIGLMTSPQGERLADYCFRELGIREMGILAMNDETGISYADSFHDAYVKRGGRITTYMKYSKTDTEFRTALTSLREKGVRHLYVSAVPQTMGFIVRQATEIDYRPGFFANAGIEGEDFITIGKNAAEGVIFTGLAPGEDFVRAFMERTKRQPSICAPQSYDAFNIIVNALRAGGGDRESIRRYLANMPPVTGVGGDIRFDSTGEVVRQAHLKTVLKGRFVKLGRGDDADGN